MSNMFNLFEEYEKRYNTWLKNSAVPKAQSWYTGSHLEKNLGETKDYLWGTAPTDSQPGTRGLLGVNATPMAGFNKKSLESFQSSRAADALYGPKIGYGRGKVDPRLAEAAGGEGVISGRMPGKVEKGVIKGYETTKETGKDILKWAFPNASFTQNISKKDKDTLADQIKSGKIDHGFVKALKQKTEPLNENELTGIEKLIGKSKEDVMKTWKDKGGFEGLMSNPAFTLGLALMQSSAEGKTIGGDIMNNFISAAKLSEHYKDRLDARTQVLGPPTQDERDLAAGALESIGISGPGWGTKAWDSIKPWGEDNTAAYNAGLNKIIIKSKEIIKKKYKYKKHQITEQDYIDAFNQLQDSKELGTVENIFGVGIEDMKSGKTKKKGKAQQLIEEWFGENSIFFRNRAEDRNRAEGGPVQAGQPYIVGEKGPEVVVPKANANVVSNDDSQVMGMLLASNPQLQNVSRPRAESILRSRFPDYFA